MRELNDEGFTMIIHGQGWKDMSPPTKSLLKIVLNHTLWHNANPVLRWMADHVVVGTDPAENLKPLKDKSTERIDGIVATIMAIDGIDRDAGPSVYEERGMLSF